MAIPFATAALAGVFLVQTAQAQTMFESLMEQAERQYPSAAPREARDLFLAVQRLAGPLPPGDLRRGRLSVFLGSASLDLGDYPQAIAMLGDARRIWEAAGVEGDIYLRTLHLLASALGESNRLPEAWPILDRALSTGRRVPRPQNDVIIGALLATAGSFHLRAGDVIKAKEALVEAKELLRHRSPSPPALTTALRGLGLAHMLEGQMDLARQCFTEAQAASRAMGENSLYYAIALANLGNFYVADGDPARAQPLLVKALHIYELTVGPDCAEIAPVAAGLAAVAIADRRFALAERYLDRAADISIRSFGKVSIQLAEVWYVTGWLRLRQRNPVQAQRFLEEANGTFRNVYGEAHYKVADCFLLLGEAYAQQNQQALAEGAYRESISRFESLLGGRHPKLAEALQQYAKVLKKSDKAGARILERRANGILRGHL
jgi:tetratricopeptide (TPR) repeat protein